MSELNQVRFAYTTLFMLGPIRLLHAVVYYYIFLLLAIIIIPII